MRTGRFALLWRDARNYLQAQLAVRFPSIYCPSLFGHYGVNSICNLRCSYCYVHEPQTYPKGFSEQGLPLEQAKKVLAHLREECLSIRFQGGEPLLYPHIAELARHAREELRFRHLSIITNGLPLARAPEKYRELLGHLDVVTLSIDGTRFNEYPDEMAELLLFLPRLKAICEQTRTGLTSNYTATWAELADPGQIERRILQYQQWIPYFYIMPVRQVGKTPLPLLKNAQVLGRKYSLGFYGGPGYPAVENVKWYRQHCNPKLKIKAMADGGLLYPCENHSGTIGSLVDHSIRELWTKDLDRFPNESCIGCGKQRFRLQAFKRLDRQAVFMWRKARGTLDWSRTAAPLFPVSAAQLSVIPLRPVQEHEPCGLR
jgi:organic radical activating enzyme